MRRHRGFGKLLDKYPILYSLFILAGIWIVYCTIKKPSSYWESRKIISKRNMWGDKMVIFTELIKGLFLIVAGSYFLASAF